MTSAAEALTDALRDRYHVERELGRGGMATVYLARDLKHGRAVAIKVLRPDVAAALGRDRFLREIATVAALAHPHILPLHDSGEANGLLYYVMPFVDGESLRNKLDRERQLSLDQALQITREVADALGYAHAHGIVHRDIKPENILLESGHAVIADFGIARAFSAAGAERLTETGLSVGTPAYMSPEQAAGDRQLDARTDVYSLAAVLYEMLAGEPPVQGATAQATIAKLFTERPVRLRVTRNEVPQQIDDAVAKALAKAPADRFATTHDFIEALLKAPARTWRLWRPEGRRAAWLAAVFVIAAAAAAWFTLSGSPPAIAIGRSDQLTAEPGLEIQPAISPGGKLVAYAVGNSTRMRIFIQPVGGGRIIPLSDDSMSVETEPRWSADGSRLLFLSRGGVSVASALGGASQPVVSPSPTARVAAAAWSPDGKEIAFVQADSLLAMPVAGGVPRLLAVTPALHSCDWSPDGEWIACVSQNFEAVRPGVTFGNRAPSGILLFPARGGAPVTLLEPQVLNASPVWWPDGRRLLFISSRDGPRDVFAVTISSSGRPRGEPVRLSTGLGANSISISADGQRLAYGVYTARSNIWSMPIPRKGPVTADQATAITTGNQVIEYMRVSRDRRWLVYDSDIRGDADIYRVPIEGGVPEQLTSDPVEEFAPDFSPDGKTVAYHSWRSGTRDIEVKPLDGGPAEHVTDTPGQESFPLWSPDGKQLAYCEQRPFMQLFVTGRKEGGGWTPPAMLASPGYGASWSPDGHSLAYIAGPAFANPGPVMVVSPGGGSPRQVFDSSVTAPPGNQVQWDPNGQVLYYKAHDTEGRASIWAVSPAGGQPRLVVEFRDPDRPSSRNYFATDGERFYFTIEDRQSDVFVAELVRR